MLSNEQNSILSLLRRSFGLRSGEIMIADAKSVEQMILHNGILLTVYPVIEEGVLSGSDNAADKLKEALQQIYLQNVRQSILQNHEGELVLEALSALGTGCIALKGWEMRMLYPKATMRQMADIDILVRPYDYKRIKTVMKDLGFRAQGESSWKHDSFKKGEVHVEMHKRLTDDSGEIQRWEREMWSRAVCVREKNFQMSPEDFYIFHFIHLHKDFMNGSLGLRRIVDTWLLQKQLVNEEQTKAELAKIGILTFCERMIHLSRAVMGEEPIDEDCEILLSHAFKYGIYGSDISYKAGRITAMGKNLRSGKNRSALSAVFLPLGRMKAQYPILEKWPILLPWCWIKRITFFVFNDPQKYYKRLNYGNIGEEDFQEMKRFFEAGGVNQK